MTDILKAIQGLPPQFRKLKALFSDVESRTQVLGRQTRGKRLIHGATKMIGPDLSATGNTSDKYWLDNSTFFANINAHADAFIIDGDAVKMTAFSVEDNTSGAPLDMTSPVDLSYSGMELPPVVSFADDGADTLITFGAPHGIPDTTVIGGTPNIAIGSRGAHATPYFSGPSGGAETWAYEDATTLRHVGGNHASTLNGAFPDLSDAFVVCAGVALDLRGLELSNQDYASLVPNLSAQTFVFHWVVDLDHPDLRSWNLDS